MTLQLPRPATLARVTLAGLLLGLGPAPLTAHASPNTAGLEDVPTRLAVPSDPLAYPDPVCLGCKIATKRPTSSSASEPATAVLTVEYPASAPLDFAGDIVLTVFLADLGRVRVVPVEDVLLTAGQTEEFAVTADLDWTWDEVEWVLVEFDDQ